MVGYPTIVGRLQASRSILRLQPTADGRSLPTVGGMLQGFLSTSDSRPTANGRSCHIVDARVQVSSGSGRSKRSLNTLGLKIFLEGWVRFPLLRPSGDYYLDLVQEFYANMLHKMDKDLPTIISHIKGVRIVLERDRLASILGILENGNTVTMDSNRRAVDEDANWTFDVACSRFNIHHLALDRRRIIHGGDFPSLLPRALAYLFGHILVKKGVDLVKSVL
ncbi:hypothetical protein M9H77_02939 [Catharanthus roseus]|uniref:Uncharacterized protein n=1 Tax=Catharanthus roseus TaxID=4058 RepID=A0ACC0C9V7_CATRO|nr:hypothetical protein M9H77_02939 [Catharanthus roseus]